MTEEVVRLRPVDGTEADAIGLFSPLDGGEITEATYPLPDPSTAGDFAGARLVYGRGPPQSAKRRRPVPIAWPTLCLAATLSIRPIAHGAQARPGAAAHRR